MSGYILCQTKKAGSPYFIENISTNIYSLEELCYYLYHNLYLIDKTIINEGLCSWIGEELSLPRLAAKLRPFVGKFASAEDILYPIFKEINYLSYEELRTLNGQLARLDSEAAGVREKKKGDALVQNGMYVNAIRVYQKVLSRDDLDRTAPGIRGKVYHNLGCAYSYLFQMEKAVECFYKAYEMSGEDKDLVTYLLAYRSCHTPSEYNGRVSQLRASDEVKKTVKDEIERFARKPEKNLKGQNVDEMLAEFMKGYHRSTGS